MLKSPPALRALGFFLIGTLLLAVPCRAYGPVPPLAGAQLDQALKKLTVLGSVLYLAAHPDDENTAMLTWLENEKLARAGYLAMTRGDGGQNLIGDEKGDLLGVIRTQELLAARRIDGAEQFFTRAIDFGFSKNPEETLQIWGKDSVLADVVHVIRTFRPDVIITRFPTTGEGGHGHHTASAMLAVEAFQAAGDPMRFPEPGLETWQPRRLFWNRFSWAGAPKPEEMTGLLQVDLGEYNHFLGKSYTELAADSRSMHKTQGFGSAERRGSTPNYLQLLAGDPAKSDIFEGIDISWSRVLGGGRVGSLLNRAYEKFDIRHPERSLPLLLEARAALAELRDPGRSRTEKVPPGTGIGLGHPVIDDPWLSMKREELDQVIRSCAGLWLEAVAADAELTPGDSLKVTVTAVNRADISFRLSRVELVGGPSLEVAKPLEDNQPVTAGIASVVPSNYDISRTQPYWLRQDHTLGLFSVADRRLVGAPENEPLFQVRFQLAMDQPGGGEQLFQYTVPVVYRWTDRVKGEQYRPVVVLPAVTLHLNDNVTLFPDASPRQVTVAVSARRPVSGDVQLDLPAGWKASPASRTISLDSSVPQPVSFNVTPPAAPATGTISARFVVAGGATYDRDLVEIDYPHIPIQTLLLPARSHAVRVDVKRRGERVGYIMGPGDEVPGNLRQTGYDVTLLTDADIEGGDLSRFDAIVIGVRAYNTRDALKRRQDRILDYVKNGGTVVVQYNTADNTLFPKLGPYPIKLGRDRVTVEEAPVTFIDPRSPLLNFPNAISPADFQGWVQERGLYFASEWDSTAYTPILASHDPGENEKKGGLLEARYGKGIFIYTGYAFFRQLPAGVPGAYRLFVNLVSAK